MQSRAPQHNSLFPVTCGDLSTSHTLGSNEDIGLPPQVVPEATAQPYYHITGTALRQNLFCYKTTSADYP